VSGANAEALFQSAHAHAAAGRFDDATADYRRALLARPQYFEALANLGKVYERQERWEEAAAAYRRALALRPGEVPVLCGLGMVLAHLGLVEASIEAWRRTVSAMPGYTQGWIALAEMLAKAGRNGEAIAAFDRALALEPGNAAATFARHALAGEQVDHAPPEYVRDVFDGFADEFDRKLQGELAYRGPEALREALAPWLAGRRALRIADLGCGTGLAAEGLRGHAVELVGVDLSAKMLEKAHARGLYDRLERTDIAAFLAAAAPGTIDLAVALEVFIYVGALDGVFAAAATALAPGGALAFSVERLGAPDGFRLAPSGRYAHSRAYISQRAAAAGLRLGDVRETVLRKEHGEPVTGEIYRLDR
jgi:predicted TPR repeat methyltransferase